MTVRPLTSVVKDLNKTGRLKSRKRKKFCGRFKNNFYNKKYINRYVGTQTVCFRAIIYRSCKQNGSQKSVYKKKAEFIDVYKYFVKA